MSAFVGLLLLDGTLCPRPVVESMLSRVRHRVEARGWAARQVRCQNSIGLGYAPLLSTPEAIQDIERPDEAQTLSRDGLSLCITSHARLDGRAALIRELELNEAANAWSDGRLILEAYARWGEEVPLHLRGDFAFAIWDATRGRLFCARDRFGTRPFYYAFRPNGFFAFANEIKALWPVPGLDAGVNETQIAHYLLARFDDKRSTFYQSVQRLPPATSLIVTRETQELRETLYWQLDGARETLLPRDDDYAAKLREEFVTSVRERMRSNGRFAVFLSGGLDSSSIAAVAEREAEPRQRPVPTLSTVFERFPQCDEREFINQTLERGEFEPLQMLGDDVTGLTEVERLVWHLDQPSPGPNSCSAWAQYGILQEAGFHVVLDGHGGDEVVCMGYERLGELLYQGDLKTAWHEMSLLRRHKIIEVPLASMMLQGVLFRWRHKRCFGRLIGLWARGQSQRQSRRETRRLKTQKGLTDRDLEVLSHRLLRPEIAARVKEEAAEKPAHTVRAAHLETLNGALQPLALEMLDAIAGAHALESRCPFWEQQLIETCLAFPSDQKMRDGFNRYVMRRAMTGLLAPPVQWRRTKTDFAPQMTESLRVAERARIDELLKTWEANTNSADINSVGHYVDLSQVHLQWLNLQNAPPESTESATAAVLLWKVLMLGIWLAQQPPDEILFPKNVAAALPAQKN